MSPRKFALAKSYHNGYSYAGGRETPQVEGGEAAYFFQGHDLPQVPTKLMALSRNRFESLSNKDYETFTKSQLALEAISFRNFLMQIWSRTAQIAGVPKPT